MSPASGPVLEPKMFPAATMDDQEVIMEGRQEQTVLGPPAFSSQSPHTDNLRMLPLEDGTSAHVAALEAEATRQDTDYASKSPEDLKALVEERDLGEIEGTGKNGNITKKDLVKALQEDDASDMKAADFKAQIAAAADIDALQAVSDLYDASGKSYSSVDAAIDKREEELTADET